MQAVAVRQAASEPEVSQPKDGRFVALSITAVVIASWLPVLVGALTRASFGWIVAVAAAALVVWLTRRDPLVVLISGFVLSSALVPSGLVTDPTHYMPVAVTGAALAARVVLDALRHGFPQLATGPIVLAVALYLAWAAVSTATSIDRRSSAVYLVGMIAVCGLAFWVIPASLSRDVDRERLLASLGVLAVAVAISIYFVSLFGGVTVFGRQIGFYHLVDLTVHGRSTGLHFGYTSGAFLTPFEPSILMVMGILALLGWSAQRSIRDIGVAAAAIVFVTPAVLLTLDRSAWLAAVIGAGAFAVMAYKAKLRVAVAASVFVFFAACFLVVLVNLAGASTISNAPACTTTCSTTSDETPIRGGTGLSGREYLWQASADAIKSRPLVGYGLGNDVQAIDPYLNRLSIPKIYSLNGLTSHSTWFRTAVEMGVPGLLLLVGTLLAAAWLFARRWFSREGRPDATQLGLAAAVAGLLPAMTFETFLLGGLTFSSLFLAVALGLIASVTRASGPALTARPGRG